MHEFEMSTKDNNKVLGLLIRFKRINSGLSLRDLGELANISHTLISNFERGKLVPNSNTIKDIFSILKLEFYDDPKIFSDFEDAYNSIFKHIIFYEFEEARQLLNQLEAKKNMYENSGVVVNFIIIRLLFYTITNTNNSETNKNIDEYKPVFEFFSDNQKQLFLFIQGMQSLNNRNYSETRMFFEKALIIGDSNFDTLIKEHYVIALSKANKYVDARQIAEECIVEYERQTNYIRAMRLRTRIAHDFIRIKKFEDAVILYNYVLAFSKKYNVKELEDRCYTRLGMICFEKNNLNNAMEYLNKVSSINNIPFVSIKMNVLLSLGNVGKIHEFYNEIILIDWNVSDGRMKNYFEIIEMVFDRTKMNEKKYKNLLVMQLEIAYKSDDAEMIEVVTKLLIDYYKKHRLYKNGLDVAEKLLHYHEFGI